MPLPSRPLRSRKSPTCGLLMYFFNASEIVLASCIAVSPAACTSFRSGREIMPSGRTGTVRVSWSSLQTSIFNTSCGPILYAGSCPVLCTAAAVVGPFGSFASSFLSCRVRSSLLACVLPTINEAVSNIRILVLIAILHLTRLLRFQACLLDLVQERLVADLKFPRRSLPIPVRPF